MATTSTLGTENRCLFDSEGRCVPVDLFDRVTLPKRTHWIDQPPLNNDTRLARLAQILKGSEIVSTDVFQARVDGLLEKLRADPQLENVLRGVHLPICLPRIPLALDYGEILEEAFLPVLRVSYAEVFPQRRIQNHCAGRLKKKIKVVPYSRHERLLTAMNAAPISAIFFPLALWGYSVRAAQQQIMALPEGFCLGGAFDAMMAFIMYPHELGRDKLTPGISMPGVCWRSEVATLYLKSSEQCLDLSYMGPLGNACSRYSNGLLYIG